MFGSTVSHPDTPATYTKATTPSTVESTLLGSIPVTPESMIQFLDASTGYAPGQRVVLLPAMREGLYWIWSPIHIYTPVDKQGKPTDPLVAQLIGWLDGSVAEPADVAVTKLVIGASNIPKCAMKVWRDGDLGPLYSYAPPAPCGCYFESIADGKTSCQTCKADAECTNAGKCRQGFCEAY